MAKVKNPVLEEKRKATITAAVIQLLKCDTAAAMTLDRVAAQAGVSKGLVSYYFKNKESLILAAISEHHRRQELAIRDAVSGSDSASEKLDRLLEVLFPSRELVISELHFQIEVFSFAKTRPRAWQKISDAYRSFRETASQLANRGGLDDEDRLWAFRLAHGLVDGMIFQLAADPSLDIRDVRRRLHAMGMMLGI